MMFLPTIYSVYQNVSLIRRYSLQSNIHKSLSTLFMSVCCKQGIDIYRRLFAACWGYSPHPLEPRFCSDPNFPFSPFLYFLSINFFAHKRFADCIDSKAFGYGSSDRISLCKCQIVSIISCNNLISSA